MDLELEKEKIDREAAIKEDLEAKK